MSNRSCVPLWLEFGRVSLLKGWGRKRVKELSMEGRWFGVEAAWRTHCVIVIQRQHAWWNLICKQYGRLCGNGARFIFLVGWGFLHLSSACSTDAINTHLCIFYICNAVLPQLAYNEWGKAWPNSSFHVFMKAKDVGRVLIWCVWKHLVCTIFSLTWHFLIDLSSCPSNITLSMRGLLPVRPSFNIPVSLLSVNIVRL